MLARRAITQGPGRKQTAVCPSAVRQPYSISCVVQGVMVAPLHELMQAMVQRLERTHPMFAANWWSAHSLSDTIIVLVLFVCSLYVQIGATLIDRSLHQQNSYFTSSTYHVLHEHQQKIMHVQCFGGFLSCCMICFHGENKETTKGFPCHFHGNKMANFRWINSSATDTLTQRCCIRPCLVPYPKFFRPSHRIFGHIHGTLNVHKKIN